MALANSDGPKKTDFLDWATEFIKAGIPTSDASFYAAQFEKDSLTLSDIPDLDKETLSSLKITTLGHQLKILRLGKDQHNVNSNKNSNNSPSESSTASYKCPSAAASIKFPKVTSDMTQPQYRKFRVDWNVYRTITKIPDQDTTAHFYSACDTDVQSSLIMQTLIFCNCLKKMLSLSLNSL